jgi:hypothetical protein
MMRGKNLVAPIGMIGFDANAVVSPEHARAFVATGYQFAVRYVRRVRAAATDLGVEELDNLLLAGLAVMPVQHVESESSWTPTDDKGREYGQTAADAAHELGLALQTTVWLDLEGVAIGTPAEQIIRYCNYWYDHVADAGFTPGLYVGWNSGLTPSQLYTRLKFTRYWGAYNLNADECPSTCGICMKQHAAAPGDVPAGVPFAIDTDVIVGDALGRAPILFAPIP